MSTQQMVLGRFQSSADGMPGFCSGTQDISTFASVSAMSTMLRMVVEY